ncbi:MAG: hypothetical protein Q9187_002652, partial [Circinaria calcarea]
LVMQASSYSYTRRGSVVSQNSKSPEPRVEYPPSPISSEDKPSSRISEAIQLLKDRCAFKLEKPWNPVKLLPGEYEELWQRLGKEDQELLSYVEDKVSIDYDPERLELVIRMPSDVHECLGGLIELDILNQLDVIANGNSAAATLARNIHPIRSTSIFLEDGARHDPDIQFRYRGAKYSSLVIEIAYTQSGKKLERLADHYILESSGSISTVVGISLDYRGTSKATLSMWYPRYGVDELGQYLASNEILKRQEFRTANGTPVMDQSLRLPLKHFHPLSEPLPPEDGDPEIVIPYERLAEYLKEAEEEARSTQQGTSKVMQVGMRKRKREETPPEILDPIHERRFTQAELKADDMTEKQDEDWTPR